MATKTASTKKAAPRPAPVPADVDVSAAALALELAKARLEAKAEADAEAQEQIELGQGKLLAVSTVLADPAAEVADRFVTPILDDVRKLVVDNRALMARAAALQAEVDEFKAARADRPEPSTDPADRPLWMD